MRKLSHNEVIEISKDRAINETEMCKKMYTAFNSDPIIVMLRNFIKPAIEDFCVRAKAHGGRAELLWINVMRKESKLLVWRFAGANKQKNTDALERVIQNSNLWTASDCSDLIRLFGAFVENKALLGHGIIEKNVENSRKGKRPGPGYIDEGPGPQRARERNHYYEKGDQTKLPHIQAAHHSALRHRRVPGGFAGYNKCTLKDCSTVKRIDSVFGLAEGCGISGTTADSIFFMQHVSDFLAGMQENIGTTNMPFIQLLPLATMGAQGHHTVLECALTLTLNNIINYKVGFYRSLKPLRGTYPDSLRTVFQAAEKDSKNKHILSFWNSNRSKLEGLHFNTRQDIDRLEKACLMNENFRNKFNFLPVKHTYEDLYDIPVFRNLLS